MDINLTIKRGEQFRPFYLFFILFGVQMGVGILSAPRHIFDHAGQDAWLSIIIAYAYMLLVTWIMFIVLSRYENADIFGIQVDLFGKLIGKLLGTVYIIFLFLLLLSLLLTYIEIVQVFIFPTISSTTVALLLLVLIAYSTLGGVRVIVGVTFLFTLLSLWIFILLYDPLQRIETSHFLPMFDASVSEILEGARTTNFTFLGLETLFFLYPYIDKRSKRIRLPAFLGLSASAFLLLLLTIISIGYFSENDFRHLEWPVLVLFKTVSLSFLERFDYFIVGEWMMIVVATAVFQMWGMTHGLKRLYGISQRKAIYTLSIALLIACSLFSTNAQIQKVNEFTEKMGFWIVFVYPVILLLAVLLKTKRKKQKEVPVNNA